MYLIITILYTTFVLNLPVRSSRDLTLFLFNNINPSNVKFIRGFKVFLFTHFFVRYIRIPYNINMISFLYSLFSMTTKRPLWTRSCIVWNRAADRAQKHCHTGNCLKDNEQVLITSHSFRCNILNTSCRPNKGVVCLYKIWVLSLPNKL